MYGSKIFSPIKNPLRAKLFLPGDKSISHRAIILASIADGTSHIYNCGKSEDIMSTINAVRSLGAKVQVCPCANNSKDNIDLEITGWGQDGPTSNTTIDCGNSATSARLLMGLVSGYNVSVIFDGDDSLKVRPFDRVIKPLSMMGAKFYQICSSQNKDACSNLPVKVDGVSNLLPIRYKLPVASAQIKSSILLAGCNCIGKTVVIEPDISRNHTELMLKQFGANINNEITNKKIVLEGPANLEHQDITVPGDISSASYFVVAALLIPGSKIYVKNVALNKTRMGLVNVLKRMGANISINDKSNIYSKKYNYGLEPVGDIMVEYGDQLIGVDVKSSELPQLIDEVPVLSLVAAFAKGTTTIRNINELRIKESDRVSAICDCINMIGSKAYVKDNNLYILGCLDSNTSSKISYLQDDCLHFDNRKDHRLVVMGALAGMCGNKPIGMDSVEFAKIGYPRFFEVFDNIIRAGG